MLTSFLQEFGCGVRKSPHREGLGNDVRGLLRAAQELLDLGFKQSFFLMVVCDLLKNLRVLQLSFQHILLIALAHAVACLGRLLYLIQQLVTSLQNAEGLLNVGQAEIDHLEISHYRSADRIGLCFHGVRFVFGDTGAQLPFARVRDVLRRAEPDVGEIAVAVARERSWAAHAELLHRQLCLGKCGDLLGNIS